jgi:hypothetical protein
MMKLNIPNEEFKDLLTAILSLSSNNPAYYQMIEEFFSKYTINITLNSAVRQDAIDNQTQEISGTINK